jgi:tetratricopeptide (TPR) repeat protein
METASFRYRAFISYSHHDERWATWLHRSMERYRVPRRLVGRQTEAGTVPARVAPVFRDREELPSATDLSQVVGAALEASAALIVICSPAAAQSRWVNEEIRMFRRLGREGRIFCLIVAGDPAGGADTQCFPAALRQVAGEGASSAEPIGADIRAGKDSRRSALLKLVAGMLGVGLDELVRRDLQRRNRRLIIVSAASVAGMATAFVLFALALIARNEAERQRARAEVQTATAQQTSEFLVGLFEVVDPSEARGNTITAREILDRGAARIDRDLAAQPVVRANLMQTMGRVYTGLGLYQVATDLLARALALRQELQAKPSRDAIATANALGLALYLKGEYADATTTYDAALAAARQLFPDGDALTSEALSGLGEVRRETDDYAASESLYREALALDRRLHAEAHPDVARSLAGLASALGYEQRFDEGEAAFREALDIRRRTLGDDHPLVAETMNNLGYLLYSAGRADEAEPFIRGAADTYRRLLGKEHPFLSSILNNLARLLLERGDVAGAEPLLDEALAGDRKLQDPDHVELVFTLNNLGLARIALGRVDSAIPLLEEARRVAEIHEHRMRGQVLGNLADAYARTGRSTDALAAIAAARPLLEAEYSDEPWYGASVDSVEASIRGASGNPEGVEDALVKDYGVVVGHWGAKGVYAQLAADRLARFYAARGRADLAAQYRRIDRGP